MDAHFHKKRENRKELKGRTRLFLIYLLCVLIPMLLTDTIFMYVFYQNETTKAKYEMENVAASVKSIMDYTFTDAANVSRKVYVNDDVNKFLEASFATATEFYEKTYDIKTDFMDLFKAGSDTTISNIVLYSDNPTIINGGFLHKMSSATGLSWYEEYKSAGRNAYIACYYGGDSDVVTQKKRRIALVRDMDYFRNSIRTKFVRVDIDYSTLVRKISDMKYSYPVYVCIGDKIILSTEGKNGNREDFEILTGNERIGVEEKWNIYGQNFRILIGQPQSFIVKNLKDYKNVLLAIVILNILLPLTMIRFINQSVENKIGRQQADIARQNAELLAMQSQINPHFLFNVLESVRMHSVLKNEDETAGMIEKLSVIVRQNVNWTQDDTRIEDEVRFIESYLQLQKYRFGDKLNYSIELEEECKNIIIPRLTLVTFVENSCVHGMEKKTTTTWIYIRIYKKSDNLIMEIEDTGNGMPDEEVASLNERMNNSTIEELKKKSHIGIINACIRLRMYTDNKSEFELESEEGVGTFTVIRVPIEFVKTVGDKGNES